MRNIGRFVAQFWAKVKIDVYIVVGLTHIYEYPKNFLRWFFMAGGRRFPE